MARCRWRILTAAEGRLYLIERPSKLSIAGYVNS
jgi:hypothetical protein